MRKQDLLDPMIEGYLGYLAEVSRKSPRTVIDVRCTLRRVSRAMGALLGSLRNLIQGLPTSNPPLEKSPLRLV